VANPNGNTLQGVRSNVGNISNNAFNAAVPYSGQSINMNPSNSHRQEDLIMMPSNCTNQNMMQGSPTSNHPAANDANGE
jgi:sensor histidine kinase regulating citrate/malate metabolism